MTRVLIVDDNAEAAQSTQNMMTQVNSTVSNHAFAASTLDTFTPDAIVIAMKPNSGSELKRLLHRTAGIPILALTYPAHEAGARQALSGRVSDFLYRDRVNAYVLEKSLDYLARIVTLLRRKGYETEAQRGA